MLYNEHCKAAKELQRKIDQLKLEGKDPSLPQKPELPKAAPPRHNSNPYIGPSRMNTSSPPPIRPMTDSQNTGDESFMLLGGQRVRFSRYLRAFNSQLMGAQIVIHSFAPVVRPWRCFQSVLEHYAGNVG